MQTTQPPRTHSRALLDVEDRPTGDLPAALLVTIPQQAAPKQRPAISKMPPSDITARVRAFLPVMAEANKKLEADMRSQPREAFDIEKVDDSEPHIEMDLALGVLEQKEPLNEHTMVIPGVSSDDDSEEEEEVQLVPMPLPNTAAAAAAAASARPAPAAAQSRKRGPK